MFVKLKKRSEKTPEKAPGKENPHNQYGFLPDITDEKKKSPMLKLGAKQAGKQEDKLDFIHKDKEIRDRRIRERSEQIKRNMGEKRKEEASTQANTRSKPNLIQTPLRIRSRNAHSEDPKVANSFDVGHNGLASIHPKNALGNKSGAKGYLKRSGVQEQPEEEDRAWVYKKGEEGEKHKILKSREEEYNENIYDSLSEEMKKHLQLQAKQYIFEASVDDERAAAYAKLLINGLYCCKFTKRSDNIYNPFKVYLPKNEVSAS